jgi:hypothetical protein
MALTHQQSALQAATDAVTALVDAASPTPGSVIFEDSGNSEVATLTFSDPAFGAANAAGVATANAITADSNATGGTLDHGKIIDGAAQEVWRGDCGVGSGDFDFNKLTVNAGDTVEITSFQYQALPQ